MDIPIYLFTGFLEAGKTRLIQETLQDAAFNDGSENILIILCEEGEEEFNPFACTKDGKNLAIETISRIEQINPDKLSALQRKHKATRIIVEYNGMWQIDAFYQALPDNFLVYQEFLVVDAATFFAYNNNMRSLVVDKLQGCEMVVFNRFKSDYEKIEYHKIARAISRNVNIAYEYVDGKIEYDDIEDPLPFDINADVIEIKDDDYAIWYRDLVEDFEKYDKKTVVFKGIVARDDRLDANSFVVGRHVMVCCADDISYKGLISVDSRKSPLKTKDWIKITAKINIRSHKLYQTRGPILDVISYEKSSAPEKEVATF